MELFKDKKFAVIFIIGVLLAAVAAFLILGGIFADGGSNAVDTLWYYEKACMQYDADDIVKYSSEYRKAELSEGKSFDDGELADYLAKAYETVTSPYKMGTLDMTVSKSSFIDEGTDRFAQLSAEYGEKADASDIERFALVSATVTYNGAKVLKVDACLVKINGRWFFFKNVI